MNKYIRKSLALIIVLAIFLVTFNINVFAAPQIINQTVEKQTITSGVVLESYNRFTTSGWIKSDVLRIDLSNENVKVDTLINKNSVFTTSSVRTLAKNSGAIAAVNGSFFDFGTGNKGYAYGPIISSGEIDLAATRNNVDTATFSLDKLNNALYTFWNTKVELIPPTGDRILTASFNRYKEVYYGLTIIDKKWGKNAPGVSEKYPLWLEMIVENGVVKEFSENKPGVAIPENGFVVLAANNQCQLLKDSFKIGDPVSYNIAMNVDTSNMQMALTGGTLLVTEGKALTTFTHAPTLSSTRAPRTAIGTSKDGRTLIVATVDGRSSESIGMTQAELAQYMYELGCANAINMDGGGSTTLVARALGTTGLTTYNDPSDGYERGVTSALGIFSIAPKGPVDTLHVTSYEANVFVNTCRAFTARGIDKYMNPVDINPKDIKWSVKGVTGTFKSNLFYPTSVGEAVVTAKLGDTVVGTCPINVLSAPTRLELNQETLDTSPGKSTTFSVQGWSKDGYSSSIPPNNIKWSVGGNVGTMSSNVFKAGETGTGYVAATVGSASVYCPVSILKPGLTKVIEDFNSDDIKLETSSKSVVAKYSKATNVYKSAKYSAKLTYDFTNNLTTNRAAYLNLPNGGYTLDSSTSKLGMWVYSSTKKPIWIGATVNDSKGNYTSEYFVKGTTWIGWKYLEVSLDNLNVPKKVTNVFVVQSTKQKASGTVYFDNLTMVYTGYPTVDITKVPKNTVPVDESYKERAVSGSDSLSFSVFGQSEEYSIEKDKTLITKQSTLATRINKYLQASVVVGPVDTLSPKVKVPLLSTTASYKALDKNGSRLISLNTTKGGLRTTESSQWFWLKNQLSSFEGKNLLVFLAIDPTDFKDSQEGSLLKETLTNYKKQNPGKNVWVFYKGSTNSSRMERGVKYISTAGFDSSSAKFIHVKVKGSTITYQFKTF